MIKTPVYKNKQAGRHLLFIAGLFCIFFSSCRNMANKPQPLLDSAYYISYMAKDPLLKEQAEWAKKFYREREFKLGWFKENKIVPQADKMLDAIKKSDEDGLDPKKYQFVDFDKLFAELKSSRRNIEKFTNVQKEIDVALSATYFAWASDFYRGTVVPAENREIEWNVKRNNIELDKALMTVLNERESQYPYASFDHLHPEYGRLKAALADYRKIKEEGGWAQVSADAELKPGKTSPVVPALRKRLGIAGTDSIYSSELNQALKKFQAAQGLKPDGALGAETVKQLNIPVEERINQIIMNMERWRWMPEHLEPDYLMVNIPEYKLFVIEDGKRKMTMNVIVGKTMNSTPVFSDKMEYVVLSPYWNVPVSIIKNEIGPRVARNPSYLDRLDMEVVDSNGERISPSSIDWNSITDENWKYTLRRRPGPQNDLGDIKFIFPNSNDIYLHDTPHNELFSQEKRGFSHGCVRVEKPVELAEYLLKDVGWNRKRILSAIAERKEKQVKLKTVLPVYLVYFTAWADDDGSIHFRDDIYGHDKTLSDKLASQTKATGLKPNT